VELFGWWPKREKGAHRTLIVLKECSIILRRWRIFSHRLDNVLMLSSRDPSFLACGRAIFDGAVPAGISQKRCRINL